MVKIRHVQLPPGWPEELWMYLGVQSTEQHIDPGTQ
jgi:hypothetical protein